MKAAMIGDNCVDFYPALNKKYPTGNIVDTGVNLHRLGIPTSIISTTGSDDNGQLILNTLKDEGLDISHLKIEKGQTAITYMEMDGLDRVHGDYVEGVLENIVFDNNDIEFAAQHNIIHTALWGKAEATLPQIKEKGGVISFDYADRLDHELVTSTLPYVDYGFYSYKKSRDKFIEDYLKHKVDNGMKIAVATFGESGSLAWDGKDFYQFGVFPAAVINTVGAGDSFIAGFIYGILNNMSIENCLKEGAKLAAQIISKFEPF